MNKQLHNVGIARRCNIPIQREIPIQRKKKTPKNNFRNSTEIKIALGVLLTVDFILIMLKLIVVYLE